MTPARRWSLAILLTATVLHAATIGFIAQRTGTVAGYAFRSLDAKEYFSIATNLVEHAAFSQQTIRPFDPDTWRTPGYPLFLATIFAVFGPSAPAAVILQQILSILNAWLVLTLARGYVSNRRAFVAAIIFAVEPYHLFYATWLLATTWFTTCLLLTWLAWRRATYRPTPARVGVLGLCGGWLVLIRPIAVLIPFGLGWGLWLTIRRHRNNATRGSLNTSAHPVSAPGAGGSSSRGILRRSTLNNENIPHPGGAWNTRTHAAFVLLAFFTMSVLLPPISWMTRNKLIADHFALSHQGGIVLAYFKATEVQLWREGRTADRYRETFLAPDQRARPHVVWNRIDRALRQSLTEAGPVLPSRAAGLGPRNLPKRDIAQRGENQAHKNGHGSSGESQAIVGALAPLLDKEGSGEVLPRSTPLPPSPLGKGGHQSTDLVGNSTRQRIGEPTVPVTNPESAMATVHWSNIAQGNKTPYDSFVISHALRRIGIRMLLEDPLSTLTCCAVRCGENLTFPLGLALRPPHGRPAHQTRNACLGLIYLALAGIALWKLILSRAPLVVTFFPIACTLALLIATTPQIEPRFRVPMIPLMAVLAVLPRRVQRQRK